MAYSGSGTVLNGLGGDELIVVLDAVEAKLR
jgi:hypothetical protein